MVSFEKFTVVWDIFSPTEHVECFEVESKDIKSTCVSEDLEVFCFGNEFGVVSVYLGKNNATEMRSTATESSNFKSDRSDNLQNKLNSEILKLRDNPSKHGGPISSNLPVSSGQAIICLSVTFDANKNHYRIVAITESAFIEIYHFTKSRMDRSEAHPSDTSSSTLNLFNRKHISPSFSYSSNNSNTSSITVTSSSKSSNFMFISTDDNKIYKISFSGNVLSCFSQSRFDNIVSIKANHGGDHLLIGGSANEILILKVPDDSLAALPANEPGILFILTISFRNVFSC